MTLWTYIALGILAWIALLIVFVVGWARLPR